MIKPRRRPRYKDKHFKGLVPYGACRVQMCAEHFKTLARLVAAGAYTHRDAIESRAAFVGRKARPLWPQQ